MILRDLLAPARDRVLGQMVERDGAVADMVEQGLEVLVEQRQPVLHARRAAPGGHRLIERIVVPGPEGGAVAGAEARDGVGLHLHLVGRVEAQPCSCPVVRWVSASKLRIDSSVSPKKSSRMGDGAPGG
jgi:hypothetical protein